MDDYRFCMVLYTESISLSSLSFKNIEIVYSENMRTVMTQPEHNIYNKASSWDPNRTWNLRLFLIKEAFFVTLTDINISDSS